MKRNTKPDFSRFRTGRRKTLRISQEELVRTRVLPGHESLPLVVEPAGDRLNLVDWARQNRGDLTEKLHRHGGVLFRGFTVDSVDVFEEIIAATSGKALRYTERSSPRSKVAGNIYTSTDYPPEQEIFLHNEQSYNLTFPLRIYFHCVTEPGDGGETPIADSREVYRCIPKEIRKPFEELGYLYVRNFGDRFGLSWQQAFQTEDREAVEDYCRANRIEYEWRSEDRLRTRQRRPVLAAHPHSGELCWFNHLTFFHVTTLPDSVREAFEADFDEDDLPNNTYYGDGTPIPEEILDELRRIYREQAVAFPWEEGDVLMLDNMLCSHARRPFSGPRKVVAGMSEPYHWDDVARSEGV